MHKLERTTSYNNVLVNLTIKSVYQNVIKHPKFTFTSVIPMLNNTSLLNVYLLKSDFSICHKERR